MGGGTLHILKDSKMAIQSPTLYMSKNGEYITVGVLDPQTFTKEGWAVVPYEKKETHNAMGELMSSRMVQDISKLKPRPLAESKPKDKQSKNK